MVPKLEAPQNLAPWSSNSPKSSKQQQLFFPLYGSSYYNQGREVFSFFFCVSDGGEAWTWGGTQQEQALRRRKATMEVEEKERLVIFKRKGQKKMSTFAGFLFFLFWFYQGDVVKLIFVVKIYSFFFLPWWLILNHINWFCHMLTLLSYILNSYRINLLCYKKLFLKCL